MPGGQETRTLIGIEVTTAPGVIAEVVTRAVAEVVVSHEAAEVGDSAAVEVVGNFFGSASGARQNPLRAWTVAVRG